MKQITLVLLAAVAVSLATACGGGDESAPPEGTGSPSATMSPDATPAERQPVAPAQFCLMGGEPLAEYEVQVTARWKGKDRVVIEGSANLPGPGSVNYWICQNGEVTASLVWAKQPTFKDGKIRAESKLVESPAGPAFDPEADFTVTLSILGEPVRIPYFTIRVPVEGRPE